MNEQFDHFRRGEPLRAVGRDSFDHPRRTEPFSAGATVARLVLVEIVQRAAGHPNVVLSLTPTPGNLLLLFTSAYKIPTGWTGLYGSGAGGCAYRIVQEGDGTTWSNGGAGGSIIYELANADVPVFIDMDGGSGNLAECIGTIEKSGAKVLALFPGSYAASKTWAFSPSDTWRQSYADGYPSWNSIGTAARKRLSDASEALDEKFSVPGYNPGTWVEAQVYVVPPPTARVPDLVAALEDDLAETTDADKHVRTDKRLVWV